MSDKNNFKLLLEEEEQRFEASGLRDEIDRQLNYRFAFIRLLSDIAELFTVRIIDVMVMMSDENIEPGPYFTPALKNDLEAALDALIERDIHSTIAKLKEVINRESEKYQLLLNLEAEVQQNLPHSEGEDDAKTNLTGRLRTFIHSLRRSDLR